MALRQQEEEMPQKMFLEVLRQLSTWLGHLQARSSSMLATPHNMDQGSITLGQMVTVTMVVIQEDLWLKICSGV